jgi:hypothetical protein
VLRTFRCMADEDKRCARGLVLPTPSYPSNRDDKRPSITSESNWRVRIEAGTLFDMGCVLMAPAATGAGLWYLPRGCTLPNFPAS